MSSSQVEQIKERLGIADIIGNYVKLEKAGANYKARCPFHHEKTASFFVTPARGTYYCFGCGAKGDIFSFVEQFEGVDFMGALKVLAERAGVELKRENMQARTERERMYACLESATIFYQKNLYTKAENQSAVDYLVARGLTKETIKEWRIGFAENDWRRLFAYLVNERKFMPAEIERVGLIIKKDGARGSGGVSSGNSRGADDYYDRFRSRIMFPLFDSSGRVIGFSGRIFGAGAEEQKNAATGEKIVAAKYVNSPETPLYHKSEVLYGFHLAKTAIRASDFTILVEGQMDMIMSQQAGFKNTVAVSGTALTTQHLEKLQRLSNNVVMAFDPDSAGVKAATRSAEIALSLGMEVRVAALPKGEDPALFILHNRDSASEKGEQNQCEKWVGIIKNAKHIVEFTIDKICEKKSDGSKPDGSTSDDARAIAKEITTRVLPFIARIPNATEQSHFVSLIHGKTGLREDALWEDLKRAVKKAAEENATQSRQGNLGQTVQTSQTGQTSQESFAQKNAAMHRQGNLGERKIVGIIFWLESFAAGETSHEKKPPTETQAVRDRFEKILSSVKKESVAVMEKYVGEKDELILEMEISYDQSEKLEAEIAELLANLERDYLKEELTRIVGKLEAAQIDHDDQKAADLLKRSNELSILLSKLAKK